MQKVVSPLVARAHTTTKTDVETELFTLIWKRRIIAAAIFAFALKVFLAWASPGSQDVLTWSQFVRDFHDIGGLGVYRKPYTSSTFFNHPPFMLHFVHFLGWISAVTGWPIRFWLRLAPSLADVGSTIVLWQIAGLRARRKNESSDGAPVFPPQAFLLIVAAPAAIAISGFHGNSDPIMMFFVLLSVWLLEQKKPIWLVGLAFGLSLNIKVASLVFVPVFLMYLPNWRQRIEYSIGVAAAFFVGGMPYLFQEPRLILQHVFGYGGLYGVWGISRLLRLLPQESSASVFFLHFGRRILLGALILFAFWLNRRPKRGAFQKPDLLRQMALLLLLFFTITPSFAQQYLAWLVPLTLTLEVSATTLFTITSTLFLGLFYAMAWRFYFTDKLPDQSVVGYFLAAEILCWLSVVVLFLGETRRLIRENQAPNSSLRDTSAT